MSDTPQTSDAQKPAPQTSATQTPATQSTTTQAPAVQALQQAAEGLLFPSETDAPLIPFFWPQDNPKDKPGNVTPDVLVRLAGIPEGTPIKSVKLATFFRPATEEEDWHNDEEKAEVKRFQNLVKTIKETLDDVKVFRVGETKVDVYMVGKVEGGYAGLKTQVVET